ncbi:hypothetical protein B0H16DRAFT_1525432 [Mycena metata]|uniref:Uncharacterized protein n=1 Tax=Mycena metata TaxID=1033252 RepID=A0AAD7JIN4_9AGAR|nr:hypothetical protein B0H16DRAFT_1525432 [Mycena metata]
MASRLLACSHHSVPPPPHPLPMIPDTAVVQSNSISLSQASQDPTLDRILYPHTPKRIHLASGGGVIPRGPVIPLRVVRDRSIDDGPVAPILPPKSSWLNRIVPGVIPAPRSARWLFGRLESIAPLENEDEEHTPLLTGSPVLRTRASNRKLVNTGIEHRPMPTHPLRRCHSFTGYVHSPYDEDELDDNMPEAREALRITATLYANGYCYERLDGVQRRRSEDFVDVDQEIPEF